MEFNFNVSTIFIYSFATPQGSGGVFAATKYKTHPLLLYFREYSYRGRRRTAVYVMKCTRLTRVTDLHYS